MEEYGCNCSFDSAGNPVDWCSFHEALRDSLAEKDKEIEQLEAENDNMRKIFDGLMAILPPEYFVKEDDDEVRDKST